MPPQVPSRSTSLFVLMRLQGHVSILRLEDDISLAWSGGTMGGGRSFSASDAAGDTKVVGSSTLPAGSISEAPLPPGSRTLAGSGCCALPFGGWLVAAADGALGACNGGAEAAQPAAPLTPPPGPLPSPPGAFKLAATYTLPVKALSPLGAPLANALLQP